MVYEYNNDGFTLKIKTNGIENSILLLNEKIFFHKVINTTIAIAKKLEVDYKIIVDEKILNLAAENQQIKK